MGPEALRDAQRFALGEFGVVVRDDKTVGLQLGHIGEGIADEHAGRDAAGAVLERLREADALTEGTRRGDQLVAAHQRRDRNLGGDRFHLAGEDAEKEPRGALSGFKEVDVRVGVIGDDGVAVLDHAIGEDAVEIERDDNGDFFTEDFPRFLEEPALGIEFPFARHGSVHAEVDGIHRRGLSDLLKKLGGDLFPVGFCEGATRGDEKGAVGRDEFHVGSLIKDTQGTADLVSDGAVVIEQLVAPADAEVSVAAEVGVEGRDLLFAFGDEDAGHGVQRLPDFRPDCPYGKKQ